MIWLALLVGCRKDDVVPTDLPTPPAPAGLLGDHPLNPFPVGALHTAGGALALDPADFDLPPAITPLPLDRLAWRTGFSPAQTSVIALPAGVDADALPDWRAPTPGEGGVRLADLTAGAWLPVMAELDAHPLAEVPTLLVRPLVAVPVGHEVAVVLTTAVTERSDRFEAMVLGDPPDDLAPHAVAFEAVIEGIEALGTPVSEVALAWSYPVGDGTLPLRSMWAQAEPTGSWSFDEVRDLADGGLPPLTWRAAEGTFDAPDFLVDDRRLALAADGSVSPTGTASVPLYVHVPTSVSDAPAGSVPILLFGHGIFGEPGRYLDDPEDGSRLLQLAEDAGFIVLGTEWRGLSFPDRLGAIGVAQDFGTMHEITDRLAQGQANVAALLALLEDGALFDDPVFRGESGQSLPMRGAVRYYGISLGGIQGAVMLANDPPVDAAVLHVGGSTWSTMLERSSNWPAFEIFMDATVEDPLVRQRLYALSQLWWDVADPIAYTEDLADRSFLLQESLGDEQVANLTTRTFARSVGLPHLEPVVEPVWGLTPTAGPLPPGSRALVQFDPEVELPPDVNRPAPITHAHDLPRTWAGTNHQTRDALSVGAEGQIVHHCGAGPCAASNQGN